MGIPVIVTKVEASKGGLKPTLPLRRKPALKNPNRDQAPPQQALAVGRKVLRTLEKQHRQRLLRPRRRPDHPLQWQIRDDHPVVGVIDLGRDPNKDPKQHQRPSDAQPDRVAPEQTPCCINCHDEQSRAYAKQSKLTPRRQIKKGILAIHKPDMSQQSGPHKT